MEVERERLIPSLNRDSVLSEIEGKEVHPE
jgi:hypothetical protein